MTDLQTRLMEILRECTGEFAAQYRLRNEAKDPYSIKLAENAAEKALSETIEKLRKLIDERYILRIELNEAIVKARIDTIDMISTSLSFEGIKLSSEQEESLEAWRQQLKAQISEKEEQ